MSNTATARFRAFCRAKGLDPHRSRPGLDYIAWIKRERREFGSWAKVDNEAFVRWLHERYPEPESEQGSLFG